MCKSSLLVLAQGPWSNFEIGGALLVPQYWGGRRGTRHFFLLTLYNFKNIGGHVPPLLPYSAVPVAFVVDLSTYLVHFYFLFNSWNSKKIIKIMNVHCCKLNCFSGVMFKMPSNIVVKFAKIYMSEGPHSHILMTGGGGGVQVNFWVWNYGQKWFFWVYARCWEFFGLQKKTRRIFWGCKTRTKGFLGGMLKKVVIFLGRQILKLWFFGYKIRTSVGPPPPPNH